MYLSLVCSVSEQVAARCYYLKQIAFYGVSGGGVFVYTKLWYVKIPLFLTNHINTDFF